MNRSLWSGQGRTPQGQDLVVFSRSDSISSKAKEQCIVTRVRNPDGSFGPVRRVGHTRLPTKWGMFHAFGFELEVCALSNRVDTAVVLVMGEMAFAVPPPVPHR